MLTWLWRLLVVGRPAVPRLNALVTRLGDVELHVEWLDGKLREMGARLATVQRREKKSEDGPSETIEQEEAPPEGVKRFAPTAFLSKRFRGF